MRLQPNEEESDDPLWRVTTTIDLADVHGPFLSFSLHADVERDDADPWHTSRRGVIDLSTRPAGHAGARRRRRRRDASRVGAPWPPPR